MHLINGVYEMTKEISSAFLLGDVVMIKDTADPRIDGCFGFVVGEAGYYRVCIALKQKVEGYAPVVIMPRPCLTLVSNSTNTDFLVCRQAV
jgi:hypothetical protein